MAVRNFTIKVSGTVAYDDQSHGSFEATAIWKGHLGTLVAQHSSAYSLEHFRRLYSDKSMGVDVVLAVLAPSGSPHGEVTLTPVAPLEAKVVTSFVMELSGILASDDNSKASFVAQWVNGVVNLYPGETSETWNLLSDPADLGDPRGFLIVALEAIAGVGKVSLSV